jgi:hypothetical protein
MKKKRKQKPDPDIDLGDRILGWMFLKPFGSLTPTHRNWTENKNGEAYTRRLGETLRRDPAADLRSAGQQLEARLKATIEVAQARGQAGRQVGGHVIAQCG